MTLMRRSLAGLLELRLLAPFGRSAMEAQFALLASFGRSAVEGEFLELSEWQRIFPL
jgi:hypothetical protein